MKGGSSPGAAGNRSGCSCWVTGLETSCCCSFTKPTWVRMSSWLEVCMLVDMNYVQSLDMQLICHRADWDDARLNVLTRIWPLEPWTYQRNSCFFFFTHLSCSCCDVRTTSCCGAGSASWSTLGFRSLTVYTEGVGLGQFVASNVFTFYLMFVAILTVSNPWPFWIKRTEDPTEIRY